MQKSKKNKIKYIFGFFTLFIISCQQNLDNENSEMSKGDKKETLEVLLIGKFHFENFNPKNNGDIVQVKIRDILTTENQAEVERISNAISDFKPNKIFVEYPYRLQYRLDSLFVSFSQNTNYKNQKRNELYQLGFKTAHKLNHNKIYGIDLQTDFPYDSLFTEMGKAKQFDLIRKDELELERIEKSEKKYLKLFFTIITKKEEKRI